MRIIGKKCKYNGKGQEKLNNQQLGKLGEDMAARYLEQQGYFIMQRNYRTRQGEIDIIAVRGNRMHFIEVKTRHGGKYGQPAESITPQKIHHMRAAAGEYMGHIKGMPGSGRYAQFDVIGIRIDHIENI